MVLQDSVLKAINTPVNRIKIAGSMKCTEMAVINYIKRNDKKLTQYEPLQVIKEIMGAADEKELLTSEVAA